MSIIIEEMPHYRIAYIRQIGAYGQDNILTMERLKDWAKSNNLLNVQSIILGIAHDNPTYTLTEDCRYDTCLVVPDKFFIKDSFINDGNIPGGSYAVMKLYHTAEAVKEAWQSIFPELIKQGYRMDETRPIIERYRTELVRDHYCELCIPIR